VPNNEESRKGGGGAKKKKKSGRGPASDLTKEKGVDKGFSTNDVLPVPEGECRNPCARNEGKRRLKREWMGEGRETMVLRTASSHTDLWG